MTITVTKTDIRKGVVQSCQDCPIAHAISRAIQHRVDVHVNASGLGVGDVTFLCDEPEYVTLPRKAVRFIRSFDMGEPVKPFSFRLRKPSFL